MSNGPTGWLISRTCTASHSSTPRYPAVPSRPTGANSKSSQGARARRGRAWSRSSTCSDGAQCGWIGVGDGSRLKLALNNLHNFFQIPVTIAVAVFDVIFKGKEEGERFYKLLELGRTIDDSIDIYSVIAHREKSLNKDYTVDAVVARAAARGVAQIGCERQFSAFPFFARKIDNQLLSKLFAVDSRRRA